ncbi:non-ribosomal peptide synthetase [Xylariaceae sp. FL0255]|nr:non-ribosomal peptide synthetase [Xylariaceae sp. FL0255]
MSSHQKDLRTAHSTMLHGPPGRDYERLLYEQAAHHFGLKQDRIEKVLPCTPFQCDVMDCASHHRQLAFGHAVYEIPETMDIKRLAAAWEEVVRHNQALRTATFVSKEGDFFQVILARGFFTWMQLASLEMREAVVEDEAAAAMNGPRCNRYVVLEDPSTNERLLVWTFSHALVDKSLEGEILRQVEMAYEDKGVRQLNLVEIPADAPVRDTAPAVLFWQRHFEGLKASVYPRVSYDQGMVRPDTIAEYRIPYSPPTQPRWSTAAICRAALAVLLSSFTNSPEALFGIVANRFETSEEHEGLICGSTRMVVPMRALCAPNQSVPDVVRAMMAKDISMSEFEYFGLCNICKVSDDASVACGFQTVLLVDDTHNPEVPAGEFLRNVEKSESFMPCANRALLLSYRMAGDTSLLVARYDQRVIDQRQMTRFLRQLGLLIQQFRSSAVHQDLPLIGRLDMTTQEDKQEIERWNSEPLQIQDSLIHDVIFESNTTAESRDKTAISAWDGDWTYVELDVVSSRLARRIRSFDLGHKQVAVPLCFEKSKWVVATMLAVLKAGWAFTLIDPKDPPARIVQVCRQTSATLAFTSKWNINKLCSVIDQCIVIDEDFLRSPSRDEGRFGPSVKPQDLAYVIFTSGSTGEPKGIMIEHRGFVSCAIKFGPALGIDGHTRSLQFASYAFGACLAEIVTTLMHGGCVCIPSDDDRTNDIPGFINRCKVNWAMLTPSYIETFQPEDVSGLETLVSVGEPLSASLRDTWAPRTRLVSAYGQSESSTLCSFTEVSPGSPDPRNIGRAVGAHSWIVDLNDPDRLAPIGCMGELVIQSPGIARGYIVALPPDKTPFYTATPAWYRGTLPHGIKLYRTGDVVVYRSNGDVVCLGRRDSQVKIAGQRVEVDEVEDRLRHQLPDQIVPIAEAVSRSESLSSKVLVAFLIGTSDKQEDTSVSNATPDEDAYVLDHNETEKINVRLQEILPKHSVPTYYIRAKELLRTATGKTDRRRLRSLADKLLRQIVHGVSPPSEKSGIPSTTLEAKMRKIWCAGFKLDPNSPNSGANFFDLGGDSITAIKIINMARSAGIALRLSDIYENPTPAGLVEVIRRGVTPYSPIPTTVYSGPVAQSFAQGRMWFLDQLALGASWYILPYGVRMHGPLNIEALTAAVVALERRHETLRTTFEEKDGVGHQVVHMRFTKELKIIDVSADDSVGYKQLLQRDQTNPFNLRSEGGWRVSVIRLGEEDHVLSIVMHHIISDGWSIDVLRQELQQLYSAALRGRDPLSVVSPLPVQYRDFSLWQRQEDQMAEHQRQLEYWIRQLSNSPAAELSIDFPRPAILSGKAGLVPITIDGRLYGRLRDFSRAHKMTAFAVLLAVFRAAHYRLTGVEDAIIGTPIANRNRLELEKIIGFFVNIQCMRITVGPDDDFESLIRQVQSAVTGAAENQDVPFERVVSALVPGSGSISRNPLAQLIFALHSQQDLGKWELEGLETEPVSNEFYTRFDVEFHLFQEAGRISGNLTFAADLFKIETIRNVIAIFHQILGHVLEKPQTPIGVLPITDGLHELRELGLLEIARTEYPRDLSVVDVFRSQVAVSPSVPAVVDATSRLTYDRLNSQSDRLANYLHRRRMAAETLIGVLAPRSCQTVVALLGILKANLAYLPLDMNSPVARLEALLSSFPGRKLILIDSSVPTLELQLANVEFVSISDAVRDCDIVDQSNGHADVDSLVPLPTSLAYVIFTSGSTNRPKGVMIEHRSIIRLAKDDDIVPRLPPRAKVAHLSNIAFDAAIWEVFVALLNGGTVVCIDYMTALDSAAAEAAFAQENVNVALFTPALLKHYLANTPATLARLEVLLVGGERLHVKDAVAAQRLVQGGVYNAYGPTENGVISTLYRITSEDSFIDRVPIGRAVSNSGSFIMDLHQQLVQPGVIGELVVAGDGLARGYIEDALEADRFVHITIGTHVIKGYRTGDRALYRPGDGQIEFLGRIDQQVKIRGHRIELAEVENAILSQNLVRDAAVVVRNQEGQEPELIGFIATHNSNASEQDDTDNQIEGWKELFEESIYCDINTISPSAIGSDFKGWTSMYDGSKINKAEMQEWLDDTIHTLLDGQAPGKVLEIGTGSGMILFNLGVGLQTYVGLEPSRSAAAFVNDVIKSVPALSGKAEVHVGTAADIDRLSGLCPDLVVLNSVVQYFPTSNYLSGVVDVLVRLPGVKRLFFGDIRSHATNRQFLAGRALRTLGERSTKNAIRMKMAELEKREEELLVDSAFFTALKNRLPDRIHHVEILPKTMRASNELSAYRYAACVHLRGVEGDVAQPVYPTDKNDWINFQEQLGDGPTLLDLLQRSANAISIAISNIPYSRTILERHLVEYLDSDNNDEDQLDGSTWISAVRSKAERCPSLSTTDLIQLGEETHFRVELSAARQRSQSGALDAVFHRHGSPSQKGRRVLFQFPTDDENRAPAPLTNRSLQRPQSHRLSSRIREQLRSLLPSYMIPSQIIVLDKIPVNANGKIDRRQLITRAQAVQKPQTTPEIVTLPDELETLLCEEFSAVLGMRVALTDHFFKLGGHSLIATKISAGVNRRLKSRVVSVMDIFDHPVIEDLVSVIRRQLISHSSGTALQYSEHGRLAPARVAPRNDIEVALCEEFAAVFGFDVGISDNFHDLGGHSLLASKLAMRISRRLDVSVSVGDIFHHPVIVHLAINIRVGSPVGKGALDSPRTDDSIPFALLSQEDSQTFVRCEIATQMECSMQNILDVYPATQLQKSFISDTVTGQGLTLTPFYIDFQVDSAYTRLLSVCKSLVQHFDIFRTVLLMAAGELYQVILEHFDVPIEIIPVGESETINLATSEFLNKDSQKPPQSGHPMIRMAVLKKEASSSSSRIILQMSHALYDGVSLEHIVHTLHLFYNGSVPPTPPRFVRFMQHLADSRKHGYDFWRSVLQDSSMTIIRSSVDSHAGAQQVAPVGNYRAAEIISVPSQKRGDNNITQATIFTAACALLLSEETRSGDVLFGRVVSGRQGLPLDLDNIVGPCANEVPVRVRIDGHGGQRELLGEVQSQYLHSLPFETLGFDEIKENCTNWPASTTDYHCCIAYQNVEYHPESRMENQQIQVGVLSRSLNVEHMIPLHNLILVGEPQPDGRLSVTVVAKRGVCNEDRVKSMLKTLCEQIGALALAL